MTKAACPPRDSGGQAVHHSVSGAAMLNAVERSPVVPAEGAA